MLSDCCQIFRNFQLAAGIKCRKIAKGDFPRTVNSLNGSGSSGDNEPLLEP